MFLSPSHSRTGNHKNNNTTAAKLPTQWTAIIIGSVGADRGKKVSINPPVNPRQMRNKTTVEKKSNGGRSGVINVH